MSVVNDVNGCAIIREPLDSVLNILLVFILLFVNITCLCSQRRCTLTVISIVTCCNYSMIWSVQWMLQSIELCVFIGSSIPQGPYSYITLLFYVRWNVLLTTLISTYVYDLLHQTSYNLSVIVMEQNSTHKVCNFIVLDWTL